MLLAGAVLVGDIASLPFRTVDTDARTVALGWTLVALAWVALGLRERWPLPVALLTILIAAVYYPVTVADGATPMICFIVALYTVARNDRLAVAVALAVGVMLGVGYGEFAVDNHRRDVDNMAIMLLSGWFLSVIAFGHAVRVREAYQHEAARQSATAERLRIAREIHDVLGHSLSLISVQAGAAVHRSAKRPGETAELVTALEFVRDTSKEALRELRATLGVLRQVDEEAPTSPAAGLDRLGELADRAAATGLSIHLGTTGDPPVLPPNISLAAYRIVQESLTNITRHARATRASITVTYAPDELRLRVEDNGHGTTAPEGSGITGMRERARALGGDLTATTTESGFRVTARLPLPAR
ncbi:sensor histidine kinase [Streptomyces sp. URMC 129]|uniref:sensor histidine kinase n=1 Tax=Streptomyces sp. URMC 129 TaxID=3423407 RepID=UPI003F1B6AC1